MSVMSYQVVSPECDLRKQKVLLGSIRTFYVCMTVCFVAQFVKWSYRLNLTEPLVRSGEGDDKVIRVFFEAALSRAFLYFFVVVVVYVTLRLFLYSHAFVYRLLLVLTAFSGYQCLVNTGELALAGIAKNCHNMKMIEYAPPDSLVDLKMTCNDFSQWYNFPDSYVSCVRIVSFAWYFVVLLQIVTIIANDRLERMLAADFGIQFPRYRDAFVGHTHPTYVDEKASLKPVYFV